MKVHILAGDAIASAFLQSGIGGTILVSRECLIDGPVKVNGRLNDFWRMRANYIKTAHREDQSRYYTRVAREYERVFDLSPEDDAFLWFEYDLFCQVNMWFVLNLLSQRDLRSIYRIAPSVRDRKDVWKGYGGLSAGDFRVCFDNRVRFKPEDISLGKGLWESYQIGDLDTLETLSTMESECFPYLREVCEAEIERKKNKRPEETLRKIMGQGLTDFNEIFHEFIEEEGVYGFGDLQVKSMYEKIRATQ